MKKYLTCLNIRDIIFLYSSRWRWINQPADHFSVLNRSL